ncbi:hypothetical protein L798_12538 [Zootermopsis nevadensis]|uniref:Uncharacterized protein n=1 Tax=Zootermopsis nevadensis TaxID=136037 RepID=A0A067QUK5_ZOONE|nr:hypothetical protein L798_12538 [Zootermopsis nevadensis]
MPHGSKWLISPLQGLWSRRHRDPDETAGQKGSLCVSAGENDSRRKSEGKHQCQDL